MIRPEEMYIGNAISAQDDRLFAERLQKHWPKQFHGKYPEGRIHSEIVHYFEHSETCWCF